MFSPWEKKKQNRKKVSDLESIADLGTGLRTDLSTAYNCHHYPKCHQFGLATDVLQEAEWLSLLVTARVSARLMFFCAEVHSHFSYLSESKWCHFVHCYK